jgi:GDP/UDP-N,N'-diacetylbacillosamine 2-epimerase (hydrolysing)
MNLIKNDSKMKLQIIVTGSHLSPKHGETYKEIEEDGFKIDFKVEIIERVVDLPSTSRAMGKAQIEISKILYENKPDLLIVLGDRYEILSAVTAALLVNIPVAHIHGGEETKGTFDNSIRHAITKMSHLHFVATDRCKKRVLQMGELSSNVFNFGGLGVDAVSKLDFASKVEIEKYIGKKFSSKNLLVTYHPETISEKSPLEQIKILLSALAQKSEINFIFTGVNADPGSDEISNEIIKFIKFNSNATCIPSMGQRNYFSTVLYCDGVIGNSSSGILEVPSLKKATINIGTRQFGREISQSVINCELGVESILKSIDKVYSKDFQRNLIKTKNPYGNGGASLRIYEVLKARDFSLGVSKDFVLYE